MQAIDGVMQDHRMLHLPQHLEGGHGLVKALNLLVFVTIHLLVASPTQSIQPSLKLIGPLLWRLLDWHVVQFAPEVFQRSQEYGAGIVIPVKLTGLTDQGIQGDGTLTDSIAYVCVQTAPAHHFL